MSLLNKLLTDEQREYYRPVIDEMFRVLPRGMPTKPARSNVQQAFVVDTVRQLAKPEDNILCIGSFTDVGMQVLNLTGYRIYGIDPNPAENGIDLHTHWTTHHRQYDLVFATSVIEHVPDDELFFDEMCKSIKPGGYGIITTDFKEGWKLGIVTVGTVWRWYTTEDFTIRLPAIMAKNSCELYGEADWSGEPDFEWEGQMYSFATYVFRKKLDNE